MMPWGVRGFGGHPVWSIVMMLFMFLFWSGLLVGGYFLVRALIRSGRRDAATRGTAGPSGSQALEILKERYARGEITKEQYDEMRGVLTS